MASYADKTVLEKLMEARGERAIKGGYKPWTLPEYRPMVEGIRTAGARSLEDLAATLPQTDVRGPAAAKILENAADQTSGNILDLNTRLASVPESYIESGRSAADVAAGRKQAEKQMLLDAYFKTKALNAQKKAAQVSSQQGSMPCCITLFELGYLTDKVRALRDEIFSPECNVAKGYTRMGKWLVPILKRHKYLYAFFKFIMGKPIAKYSDNKNPALIPICVAWCILWEIYGRI